MERYAKRIKAYIPISAGSREGSEADEGTRQSRQPEEDHLPAIAHAVSGHSGDGGGETDI